jgi:hypothetical protein
VQRGDAGALPPPVGGGVPGLADAHILVVSRHGASRHESAIPIRQSDDELQDGVYLCYSTEKVPLSPLMLSGEQSDHAIKVFSRASDRKASKGTFREFGSTPKESEDDGTSIRYLKRVAMDEPNVEKLFGLEKQLKQTTDTLRSWTNNPTFGCSPMLLVGEEGTGKTAVVTKALSSMVDGPQVIIVSGAENPTRPQMLVLSMIARLFHMDRGFDFRVINQLKVEGERLGTSSAERLASWLQRSETVSPSYFDSNIDKSGNSNTITTVTYRRDQKSVPHGEDIAENYDDFITFVSAYAEDKGDPVLVWLQDAQLYETQVALQIEVLFDIASRRKPAMLLLLGEFRAKRTMDMERLKHAYARKGTRVVETMGLSQSEIHSLVAENLSIANSDLPQEVSSSLFKTAGGNPKATRDLVRIIEKRRLDSGQGGDSTTQMLLILPDVLRNLRATELKEVSRVRIASLKLSEAELDALTLACLCPSHELPAAFFSDIFGESGASAAISLERQGVFRSSDDIEEWRFRFEHIAAREAAVDLVLERDHEALDTLTKIVAEAWRVASFQKDMRFRKELREVICQLAEVTENAEILAPTIVPAIMIATERDLDKLRKWASVLRRTFGKDSGTLVVVRKFLLVRIKILEALEGGEYARFSGVVLMNSDILQDFPTPSTLQVVVPVFADSFGYLLGWVTTAKAALAIQFVEFLCRLHLMEEVTATQNEWTHVADATMIALVRICQSKIKPSAPLKALAQAIVNNCSSALLALYVLKRAFLVLARSQEEAMNADLDQASLTKLASRAISEAKSECYLPESRQKVLAEVQDSIAVIWHLRARWSSPDGLRSAAEGLASLVVEFDQPPSASIIFAYATMFISEASNFESEEMLALRLDEYLGYCGDMSNSLKSAFIGHALATAYRNGIPHLRFCERFSEVLKVANDLKELTPPFVVGIAEAVAIVDDPFATQHLERLVLDWYLTYLTAPFRNSQFGLVLNAIKHIGASVGRNTEEWFESFRQVKTLTQNEKILFDLYRRLAIQCDLTTEADSFCQDTFDQGKNEFLKAHAVSGSILAKEIKNVAFRLMFGEIKKLSCPVSNDCRSRVKDFRNVHEYRRKSRVISTYLDDPTYWKTRWRIMALSEEVPAAITECRQMLADNTSEAARESLVPNLIELLLPHNDDVEKIDQAKVQEAIEAVSLWADQNPVSEECADAFISIARVTKSEAACVLMRRVELVAGELVKKGEQQEAQRILSQLVSGYYEKDAPADAERVAMEVIEVMHRMLPRPSPLAMFTARNNHGYTRLAYCAKNSMSVTAVINDFRKLAVDAQETGSLPLISYNLAVALALDLQIEEAITIMKWIHSDGRRFSAGTSDEMEWLFTISLAKIGDQNGMIELRNTSLRIASYISVCTLLLKIGSFLHGRMWLHGFFGYLKNVPKVSDSSVWKICVSLANAYEQRLPAWISNRAVKAVPQLLEQIKNAERHASLNFSKDADCLCESGRLYKNCCQNLFQH